MIKDVIEDLNIVELPDGPTAEDRVALRRAQFNDANASLALEGMRVDQIDLSIQDNIARGTITHDQAVAFYLQRANKGSS